MIKIVAFFWDTFCTFVRIKHIINEKSHLHPLHCPVKHNRGKAAGAGFHRPCEGNQGNLYGINGHDLSDNAKNPTRVALWQLYKDAGVKFFRQSGGNNSTKYN